MIDVVVATVWRIELYLLLRLVLTMVAALWASLGLQALVVPPGSDLSGLILTHEGRLALDWDSDKWHHQVHYEDNYPDDDEDSEYLVDRFPDDVPTGSESNVVSNEIEVDKTLDESGNLIRPRLPQAIIIGVKKGGTRALLEFLRVHPDIRAPGPEIHFFDRHYDKGLDWYRNLMPATNEHQMTIEKTPSYFVTKTSPSRVYNMSRETKLIVVVRDPVTRAISDYTQVASKRTDLRSFEQMAFLDNATGPVATSWGAIKIGLYAKHVDRWLHFFPLNQIHFISGEQLINDPAGELASLQDFLGIRRYINERHFYFNATKGFPCLIKSDRVGIPHCLGKTKGRTHPVIDEKVLQRLRNFYAPFNEKFYRLTGINFGWP